MASPKSCPCLPTTGQNARNAERLHDVCEAGHACQAGLLEADHPFPASSSLLLASAPSPALHFGKIGVASTMAGAFPSGPRVSAEDENQALSTAESFLGDLVLRPRTHSTDDQAFPVRLLQWACPTAWPAYPMLVELQAVSRLQGTHPPANYRPSRQFHAAALSATSQTCFLLAMERTPLRRQVATTEPAPLRPAESDTGWR
mmetsp:Transcript_8577/g.18790  ORF Transcript_8577/g.18790 Transcript_8577/m.18790 type:complete len:202 (-) Transcript_8577:87-692(-)